MQPLAIRGGCLGQSCIGLYESLLACGSPDQILVEGGKFLLIENRAAGKSTDQERICRTIQGITVTHNTCA
jgi:hypothetical protein